METLSAIDAKREFGEILVKAQKGPVAINKNGKPVAVMISATKYETLFPLNQDLCFFLTIKLYYHARYC